MNLSTLLLCGCPLGAAITDITLVTCPEDFGQVQKVVFQRKFASAGVLNKIPQGSGVGGIEVLLTWTGLMSAVAGTKTQISPFIQSPENEPGEKKEFGGGNQTLDGIPIIVGRDPATFEGMILSYAQSTIAEIKELMCEEMAVYLIDEHGRIAGSLSGTDVYPFPIHAFFMGDKKLGGFEEPDSNKIAWSFKPNWSDAFDINVPDDFDALSELVNP